MKEKSRWKEERQTKERRTEQKEEEQKQQEELREERAVVWQEKKEGRKKRSWDCRILKESERYRERRGLRTLWFLQLIEASAASEKWQEQLVLEILMMSLSDVNESCMLSTGHGTRSPFKPSEETLECCHRRRNLSPPNILCANRAVIYFCLFINRERKPLRAAKGSKSWTSHQPQQHF